MEFTLNHFKSFKKGTLHLAPLTLLIGANASGKSNAIEGLKLLSWLANGNRLSSLPSVGKQVFRGQLFNLGYDNSPSFSFSFLHDQPALEINLEIENVNYIKIVHESLSLIHQQPCIPYYWSSREASGEGEHFPVSYNNFMKFGAKPQIVCSNQFAVMTQLDSTVKFNKNHAAAQKVIPLATKIIREFLSRTLFLDANPVQMRNYAFAHDKSLNPDGSNLSGILYQLWNQGASYQQKILGFIQSLPEQNIVGIDFLTGPRGELMVKLVETFGGQRREYDTSLLSDGTLRVLAMAAALLSVPEDSLLVIEELDNGVHPSRANLLLHQMETLARERNLRLLLTSHNPALLDALSDGAVPNVMFCYRDRQDGSSRLIRLMDTPDYPELIAQGSLGHLMTSGTLERFIKNTQVPEEKKAKAMAWLDQLDQQTEALRQAGREVDLP